MPRQPNHHKFTKDRKRRFKCIRGQSITIELLSCDQFGVTLRIDGLEEHHPHIVGLRPNLVVNAGLPRNGHC